LEHIDFDSARVLPCYVLQLDFGKGSNNVRANTFKQNLAIAAKPKSIHPRLVQEDVGPGDAQRITEAKKAEATKWFSFGYGSATGTSLVIEEVGATSDGEEDYGDFQENKVQQRNAPDKQTNV